MNDLTINAEKDTLKVTCHYETGIIKLEGVSYPADAAEFFNPIFEWLETYIEQVGGAIVMNLFINYLNTSSTKCLFDIVDRMEEYYNDNNKAQVNWYYEKNDEDIKEIGLEFQEDMQIPFEVLSY
jgi:hypothetical protein